MEWSIPLGAIAAIPGPAGGPGAPPPPTVLDLFGRTLGLCFRHAPFLFAPHFILGLFVFASVESRGAGPNPSLSLLFVPVLSPMFPVSLAVRLNEFFLFVQIPLLAVFFVLAAFSSGVVTSLALDFDAGRRGNPVGALLASLRHLPQLLGGSLVLASLVAVLFYVPSIAVIVVPFLLPALPLLSALALLLISSLSLFAPAALVEGRRSVGSLRRSWDLSRGNRPAIFGAYLLLVLLAIAIWDIASHVALVVPGRAVDDAATAIGASLGGAIFAVASAITYDVLVRYREGPAQPPAGTLG